MTDLLLRERDQAALRAVIASEPETGAALPGTGVLQSLSRLIDCDAIGIALVDGTGAITADSAAPRAVTAPDDPIGGEGMLGIQHLRRTHGPDGSGTFVVDAELRW